MNPLRRLLGGLRLRHAAPEPRLGLQLQLQTITGAVLAGPVDSEALPFIIRYGALQPDPDGWVSAHRLFELQPDAPMSMLKFKVVELPY